MSPELIELVAGRFKALAEPARLQILSILRTGEMTVGQLIERTGFGQANVSKHLQLLHRWGFVKRQKEGLFAYYSLADKDIFKLCDIMCGRLQAETTARRKALGRT